MEVGDTFYRGIWYEPDGYCVGKSTLVYVVGGEYKDENTDADRAAQIERAVAFPAQPVEVDPRLRRVRVANGDDGLRLSRQEADCLRYYRRVYWQSLAVDL